MLASLRGLAVALLFGTVASAQVSSLDPSVSAVATGGHWEAAGQSGTIRLIVVTGERDHVVSTLHAQWIADGTEQSSSALVRSVLVAEIPPGVWALETPRFELVDKRWRAVIEGTRTHAFRPERQGWMLTFGAPGEVGVRTVPASGLSANKNVYLDAFRAAVEEMAQRHSRFGVDFQNLFVEKDLITEGFPDSLGQRRVTVLDPPELCDQFKRVGTFKVLAVRPPMVEGDQLIVAVMVYQFSCKTRRFWFGTDRFEFGLSDGAAVSFRLDESNRRFVVQAVRLWGV